MTDHQAVSAGPLAAFRARRAAGELQDDPAQAAAAERLERLHQELAEANPRAPEARGLLARLGIAKAQAPVPPPRGLFLHGPVGRGKSMLMDLFFEAAPVAARRRVHFHEFMLETHSRLKALREHPECARDPLAALGAALASEARLLCFDELLVQNIADAMILGRLFEALLDRGVVIVATSNLPPERLYENGLNRVRFLPFVALLRARLDVIALDGAVDHRLGRLGDVAVYHHPLDSATDHALLAAFAALADGAAGTAELIEVGARCLAVPRAAAGVAWFDFEALCEQPLGAADYLALAERYHTVIVAGVPRLTPDRRNEARRFMTLVDALYERRINLVVGAEAPPADLYPAGDGAFEFQRTVSRLMEMQSRAYLEAPPRTGGAAAGFTPFALTTDVI